ncbi:methyltransferase-like protein 7B isoform X1 [Camelus ferus]|uniref:Methyltransferase-like protein 7B isoform X1 n=1 Tax=Camelus ferus TaxID=419612 RepID=A0A8B7KAH8_CAMFR|nr:methyltransferase-like protein 7B isoform X1 [Camelus ferus]
MDALVRLLQLLVLLLTLPLHIMALLGFWEPLCKSYFPYLMAVLAAKTNRKMEGKKRELFSQIKGLAGASGKVALLELGCGTGANFQFYPSGCRITCLDPNPNFEKFLTKSMAENRHLEYERFVVAFGEDMKQLADGSMDVVVCTLVLCSVQSPRKVLQEVHRVLRPVLRLPICLPSVTLSFWPPFENVSPVVPTQSREARHTRSGRAAGAGAQEASRSRTGLLPELEDQHLPLHREGGLFFFWEHVAEPRGSWAFLWQQVAEPTWKHIGDGCRLTRETWKDLESAQFSELQMERQPPPFKWLPVGPHIMGKAVK